MSGLLEYLPDPKLDEAKRIVEHSNRLGDRAIYDSLCQAEHGMFYVIYGETPEEVLNRVSD